MTAKTKVFGNDYLTLKFSMENKKPICSTLSGGWEAYIMVHGNFCLDIPFPQPLTFSPILDLHSVKTLETINKDSWGRKKPWMSKLT